MSADPNMLERIRNLEAQIKLALAAQDDIRKRIAAAQQMVNMVRNAAGK